MPDPTVDLRFRWVADYRIKGARGSLERRASAIHSARTRRQIGAHGQTAVRGLLNSAKPVVPAALASWRLAALEALQGARSLWPVDTGYSIAGFGFLRNQLSNRAEYAASVEERTGAAAETLRRFTVDIDRRADELLQRRIEKGLEV